MDHSSRDAAPEILALERAALARWCQGDPSGFLEISAPDVVYFDPFLAHRIDGLAALTAYYDGLRGKIRADGWEILTPIVQACGEVAVLTFQFVSWAGGQRFHWNTTEVYRRDAAGWRLIQSHWSLTSQGRAQSATP
jgi:hypothetical protein